MTGNGKRPPDARPPLPSSRGPLSESLIELLREPAVRAAGQAIAAPVPPDPAGDVFGEDFQLSLYLLYELHYRSFRDIDERWEWDPGLLTVRARLEADFEARLREELAPHDGPLAPEEAGTQIKALIAEDGGSELAAYMAAGASLEEFQEFLIHRSAYQLKEADPHSWAIPRLEGQAKAALVEVQADEYGGGRPERVHATLYAKAMAALGLDCAYGAYLDRIPGVTLATVNLMSLFGLHRRLRGAIVGHLAGFEMTSPLPNGRYASGIRRLGLGEDALDFFDEHVEADSVHENIALYDMAQGLARSEPSLSGDIVFGVRALLLLDGRFAAHLLDRWGRGESSLLELVASPR